MTIGTLAYKNTSKKSFFNTVLGRYRTPKTVLSNGNGIISTAQSKFGVGSFYTTTGATGYIYAQSNSDFAYGTNPFTCECWIRWVSYVGVQFIFDQRPDANSIAAPVIYWTGTALNYYVAGSIRITYNWTPSNNTWYHIAVCKSGTSTKLFVDGIQVGSTYTDNNTYVQGGNFNIGGTYSLGTNQFNGYIDEPSVSNIARYTSNFTPSTVPLKNDNNRILLLHLDTDITDYVY